MTENTFSAANVTEYVNKEMNEKFCAIRKSIYERRS